MGESVTVPPEALSRLNRWEREEIGPKWSQRGPGASKGHAVLAFTRRATGPGLRSKSSAAKVHVYKNTRCFISVNAQAQLGPGVGVVEWAWGSSGEKPETAGGFKCCVLWFFSSEIKICKIEKKKESMILKLDCLSPSHSPKPGSVFLLPSEKC